jgi:hypothetical protein
MISENIYDKIKKSSQKLGYGGQIASKNKDGVPAQFRKAVQVWICGVPKNGNGGASLWLIHMINSHSREFR